MNTTQELQKFQIESIDHLLSLLSIYLEEFNQRNIMLWKQVFTYYFAILIVMILPFISSLGVDFGDIFPKWIFPAIGLTLSFVFLIVSLGYATRLKMVSDIYNKLLMKLDRDYQRTSLAEVYNKGVAKVLNCHMTILLCWVMFLTLLYIGVILIIISV